MPVMPLISAGIVLLTGGLTLWFDNETFIKMKPTVLYLIFAALLASGLLIKRLWLKLLMGSAIRLTDAGWRGLTRNWIFFFLGMAAVNEVVWRSFSTEFWGGYKIAAVFIALAFALAQAPLIMKHEIKQDAEL